MQSLCLVLLRKLYLISFSLSHCHLLTLSCAYSLTRSLPPSEWFNHSGAADWQWERFALNWRTRGEESWLTEATQSRTKLERTELLPLLPVDRDKLREQVREWMFLLETSELQYKRLISVYTTVLCGGGKINILNI